MTGLFRSKSCGGLIGGVSEFNPVCEIVDDDDPEEEFDDNDEMGNRISTPFINSGFTDGGNKNHGSNNQLVDILVGALRKSLLVTCSVEREDVSSMDISYPTEVRHVSHVTFDRFNGFLGLPVELEPEVPTRVPSASVSVFGVSAKSMQCSYDEQGNSVPTILLLMQKRLYSGGGLKAEGIFRLNAENSQEEYVRDQLNKGFVPHGIDVHCLAGLIKAWLRELPTGVLDSLTPEQVLHCNTENDFTQLVKLLAPTEAAVLDWAINLMADVAQHEQYNKMNARNIAMVFAPNMTQMADPLTALIHAVQVMNLLKTLILKTLREREESDSIPELLSSCPSSPCNKTEPDVSSNKQSHDGCVVRNFLTTSTLIRLESEKYKPVSSCRTPFQEYENSDWLSLRKGVRKLCRHPVFQLTKSGKKTSRDVEIVHNGESNSVFSL